MSGSPLLGGRKPRLINLQHHESRAASRSGGAVGVGRHRDAAAVWGQRRCEELAVDRGVRQLEDAVVRYARVELAVGVQHVGGRVAVVAADLNDPVIGQYHHMAAALLVGGRAFTLALDREMTLIGPTGIYALGRSARHPESHKVRGLRREVSQRRGASARSCVAIARRHVAPGALLAGGITFGTTAINLERIKDGVARRIVSQDSRLSAESAERGIQRAVGVQPEQDDGIIESRAGVARVAGLDDLAVSFHNGPAGIVSQVVCGIEGEGVASVEGGVRHSTGVSEVEARDVAVLVRPTAAVRRRTEAGYHDAVSPDASVYLDVPSRVAGAARTAEHHLNFTVGVAPAGPLDARRRHAEQIDGLASGLGGVNRGDNITALKLGNAERGLVVVSAGGRAQRRRGLTELDETVATEGGIG